MKRITLLACAALLASACGRGADFDEDEKLTPAALRGTSVSTGSCGVERWDVKTGSDSNVSLVNLTPQDTTIGTLAAIPAPSSLASGSPRFTYSGSPELQAYRLTNVTLTQYKLENDSDYHLVLQDGSGNTMIAEIPYPGCVSSSSAWTSQINSARNTFDAQYTASTTFQTANVPVTLTGVGFFDILHGQTGVAPNGIELHSVLSICFGTNCAGSPPPPPPPGGGTLTNGNFETGSLSGWTTAGVTSVSTTAHTGSYSAMVGSTSPSTDSSISQTFSAPSGATQLSFWYRVVCPDTVTYDWASATLKDNTAGTTATMLSNTCSNSGAWAQATASVTAGHSYTLTLSNHDDNYSSDPTYTLYDDVAFNSSPPPPPPPPTVTNPFQNPGFETGSLSSWSSSGVAAAVSGGHTGSYSARLGSTSPSTDSSISQTVTIPSGATRLTFWYKVVCPDTVTYDWASATLKDNTSATTATVLAKTCSNSGTWVQASASVTAGHSVTLTLSNHDDNYTGDATYTLYDDINVQ